MYGSKDPRFSKDKILERDCTSDLGDVNIELEAMNEMED